jgi:hypothetical protein
VAPLRTPKYSAELLRIKELVAAASDDYEAPAPVASRSHFRIEVVPTPLSDPPEPVEEDDSAPVAGPSRRKGARGRA